MRDTRAVQTRELQFSTGQRALYRALATRSDTVDLEARKVTVAWSTGAIVRRYDWSEDTEFEEELVMEGARLDRFNQGAPYLNSHQTYDLDHVWGRTLTGTTRLEGNVGLSDVRFSQRARAMEHLRDIADGVCPEVSIGYWIYRVERVDRSREGKIPLWRVVDWEPFELSGVPIAADSGAGYRAANQPSPRGLTSKEPSMNTKNAPEPTAEPVTDKPDTTEVERAAQARGEKAERARVTGIRETGKKLGISQERLDSFISDGTPLEQARAAMIDDFAAREEPAKRVAPEIEVTRESKRTDSVGLVNALLHRGAPGRFKLDDNGRRFAYMSPLDVARMSLEARGINVRGWAPARIAQRAVSDVPNPVMEFSRDGELGHTTGDFALILADVQNKSMQKGYSEYSSQWKVFCNQGQAQNFKDINTYQLSEAPDLEVVNEQGEYTFGHLTESKESYRVVKTGKRVGITFEMIVNDDMGAFTRIPYLFGQAGARREADVIWALLTGNPDMADGVDLFHADHGANLSTGNDIGPPDIDGVNWAMNVLGLQRGPKGVAELNLQLGAVAVPFKHRLVAAQLKASLAPAQASEAVPDEFKAFTLIVEPRLTRNDTDAWYAIADKNQVDTIEYAYLAGYEGVTMEERIHFATDGLQMKFRHIFGGKVIDWRAFAKNTGD
ncbi:MAG: hypothetical protein IT385_18955 [Deltaproteobacteria bacterium]|nr:hypothetical protein [Deltaproteobacteria bacterium]